MAENLGSGSSVYSDRPLKKFKYVVHGEDLQEELVEKLPEKELQEKLVEAREEALKFNQLVEEVYKEDEGVKSDVTQSSGSSSRSSNSDKSVIEDDKEQNPPSIESIIQEAREKGWLFPVGLNANKTPMQRVWPEHSFPLWMDLDEEEEYRPQGVQEVDWDLWRKYYRELSESDNFDSKHYPGDCRKARIRPIMDLKGRPEKYQQLRAMSEFAIADYNRENNTNYCVEDVEKANVGGVMECVCYFITLRAKNNKDEPDHRVFQAAVMHNYYCDGDVVTSVRLCRPKPLAPSTSSD